MGGHTDSRSHWIVDRRIPIALVATILLQTVALVGIGAWYASDFASRIERNAEVIEETRARAEAALAIQKTRLDALERRQSSADELAARLEERLVAQGRQLDRIERTLDQLSERMLRGTNGRR